MTNASGQFSATGLRVGGPYRVTAQAEGMQDATVEDLYTQLAERTSVTLVAQPIAQLTGVEVTGASERDVAIGAAQPLRRPGRAELPSISRDIKDVVRIDPKAWVDPTNSDALEIAGVNNRYNSDHRRRRAPERRLRPQQQRLPDPAQPAVGGRDRGRVHADRAVLGRVRVLPRLDDQHRHEVRHQRIHGLRASTTRATTACSATGRKDTRRRPVFDEEIYGGTFGGPIIKDRLFFFLSYEKLDRTAPQDIGADRLRIPGRGAGVTQADYDRIRQIGLDVYGFDVGETPSLRARGGREDPRQARLEHQRLAPRRRCPTSAPRATSSSSNDQQQPGADRLGAPSNWYDRAILDGDGRPCSSSRTGTSASRPN